MCWIRSKQLNQIDPLAVSCTERSLHPIWPVSGDGLDRPGRACDPAHDRADPSSRRSDQPQAGRAWRQPAWCSRPSSWRSIPLIDSGQGERAHRPAPGRASRGGLLAREAVLEAGAAQARQPSGPYSGQATRRPAQPAQLWRPLFFSFAFCLFLFAVCLDGATK
jgi:hypothetical protein